MVTSWPINRLGRAIGMSAPCSKPRLKPAGCTLLSRDADDRWTTQIMATATITMVRIRVTIRGNRLSPRGALACVSDMVCVEGRSMFFSRRATQAEYCDQPNLPATDLADNYRQL